MCPLSSEYTWKYLLPQPEHTWVSLDSHRRLDCGLYLWVLCTWIYQIQVHPVWGIMSLDWNSLTWTPPCWIHTQKHAQSAPMPVLEIIENNFSENRNTISWGLQQTLFVSYCWNKTQAQEFNLCAFWMQLECKIHSCLLDPVGTRGEDTPMSRSSFITLWSVFFWTVLKEEHF